MKPDCIVTIPGHETLAGHGPARPAVVPFDLAKVITAWPSLPDAIRACIIAMIEAAASEKRNG